LVVVIVVLMMLAVPFTVMSLGEGRQTEASDTYDVGYYSDGILFNTVSYGSEEDPEVKFDPIPQKDDSVFLGWSTDSAATGADYTVYGSRSFDPSNADRLYAVWGQIGIDAMFEMSVTDLVITYSNGIYSVNGSQLSGNYIKITGASATVENSGRIIVQSTAAAGSADQLYILMDGLGLTRPNNAGGVIDITPGCSVNLQYSGKNEFKLNVGGNAAATVTAVIRVSGDTTFVLQGQGKTSGDNGPGLHIDVRATRGHTAVSGIGGNGTISGTAENGGNIQIESGNLEIDLYCSSYSCMTGIGGGGSGDSGSVSGSGGNITINGGSTRISTSGTYTESTAIGGGATSRGIPGSSGNISINGGKISIIQESRTVMLSGSGIGGGGGYNQGAGGIVDSIVIKNSDISIIQNGDDIVTGAGIGGGGSYSASSPGIMGPITISDSNIVIKQIAQSYMVGAGIGGGGIYSRSSGSAGSAQVVIENSSVEIDQLSEYVCGAGIGGGGSYSGRGGSAEVSISDSEICINQVGYLASAGIGGGGVRSGSADAGNGTVTITGGIVEINRETDTGRWGFGAGIGGGGQGISGKAGSGTVTMNDATVHVTNKHGNNGGTYGLYGAGIGGGGTWNTQGAGEGTVVINGGDVRVSATSGNAKLRGAGIGGGGSNTSTGAYGDVTVTSGSVTVTMSSPNGMSGAGIGGGSNQNNAPTGDYMQTKVSINGGTVTVNRLEGTLYGQDIGTGGTLDNNSNIISATVNGGSIKVTGGEGGNNLYLGPSYPGSRPKNTPVSSTGPSEYVNKTVVGLAPGDVVISVLVRADGVNNLIGGRNYDLGYRYHDFGINAKHEADNDLYVYLPSNTANHNDVSVEVSDAGEVKWFRSDSSDARTNNAARMDATNTYYRVNYSLGNGLINREDIVHVKSGQADALIETLFVYDTYSYGGYVAPQNISLGMYDGSGYVGQSDYEYSTQWTGEGTSADREGDLTFPLENTVSITGKLLISAEGKQKRTVSYIDERGIVPTGNITAAIDDKIYVGDGSGFDDTDFEIGGWLLNGSADNTYDPGDEYTVVGNTSFVAVWNQKVWNIKYEFDPFAVSLDDGFNGDPPDKVLSGEVCYFVINLDVLHDLENTHVAVSGVSAAPMLTADATNPQRIHVYIYGVSSDI
jgi:hypothetical protein